MREKSIPGIQEEPSRPWPFHCLNFKLESTPGHLKRSTNTNFGRSQTCSGRRHKDDRKQNTLTLLGWADRLSNSGSGIPFCSLFCYCHFHVFSWGKWGSCLQFSCVSTDLSCNIRNNFDQDQSQKRFLSMSIADWMLSGYSARKLI